MTPLTTLVDTTSFQQPLFKNRLITGLNALELDAGARVGVGINDPAPRLEPGFTSEDSDH